VKSAKGSKNYFTGSLVLFYQLFKEQNMWKYTFLSDAPPYPKEHCVLEDTQASPVCPSGNRNIKMKMSTEY
jgi:hypothetical protein